MGTRENMTRGAFFRCCAAGACSLAAVAAAPGHLLAQGNPELERTERELDSVRVRYARMLSVLDHTLDDQTKSEVFNQLGRKCAQQFSQLTWEKYPGDFKGYLAAIQGPNGWCAKAEYDEKAGVITIADKASRCTCPLVREGTTSVTQCLCTLGWQEETYSRLLGKPVRARLVKSVLRGGECCVFRIEIVG